MVWDAVMKLESIPRQSMVLRITFHKGSYPIVMQWSKTQSPELEIGTEYERDNYVSKELWLVDSAFSSINAFADWVDKVEYK